VSDRLDPVMMDKNTSIEQLFLSTVGKMPDRQIYHQELKVELNDAV
jgi:hypothetical protein